MARPDCWGKQVPVAHYLQSATVNIVHTFLGIVSARHQEMVYMAAAVWIWWIEAEETRK